MPKVAYINHNGLISGAEVSLLTVLANLDRQRYQPFLITPTNGNLAEKAAAMGISVLTLGNEQFFEKPTLTNLPVFIFRFWLTVWKLRQILRSNQIELAHANSIRAGLVTGLAARLAGRPVGVVVHVRDRLDKSVLQHRLTTLLTGYLASQLICISDFVQEQTRELLGAPQIEKLTVIHNGVKIEAKPRGNEETQNSFRVEFGLVNLEGPLLGVVGQLTPWKGQMDALQAFRQLLQSDPARWNKARLVIVGEAKFTNRTARYDTRAYERQLREFVKLHHLETHVIFTGERPDIEQVFAALDLLIIPSWHEPFGRVAIEAMAAQTPVLATCAGGIPEIIEHAKSGWLVKPHCPDELAKAIVFILDRPELVREITARAAQEVSSRFEIGGRVREVEKVYQSILEQKTYPSQPIRLLYINHTGQVSGAEVSLLRTLKRLDKTRFEVCLACPTDTPLWQKASRIEGLRLVSTEPFTFTYRVRFTTFTNVLNSCRQVYRLVQKQQPQIIHANSIRSGLICGLVRLGMLLSFKKRPGLVVHIRDDLSYNPVNLLIRLVITVTSSRLLPISSYIFQRSQLLPRPGQKHYQVLYDGVDLAEFDPARLTAENRAQMRGCFGIDKKAYPVIGLVGQITPWKGHREAIVAMFQVLETFPQARLLIVGTPKFTGKQTRFDTQEYYANLKKLVQEMGLEKQIIFTGELQDMPGLMYALDIFLLCSWSEPFGLVYIEAMAMERPVVATEVGGPADIVVEGQTGLKVKPREPEAIAQALIRLAQDPQEARRMGQAGRQRVRQLFTIERQVSQLEKLYNELVTP